MKPPAFAYTDPRSTPQALECLAQWGDDGKVLTERALNQAWHSIGAAA